MGILKVGVKRHRDRGTAGLVEGKEERNNVVQQGQCKEKEREIMWCCRVSARKRREK
jgi:hypothetical protein